MLNKGRTAILATVLGLSMLAFTSVGASAATVLPTPESALADSILDVTVLEVVKKKQDPNTIWNRSRHGERCLYRIGSCRHFYGGYYYETPWWGLPLATGGEVVEHDFGHHTQAAMS